MDVLTTDLIISKLLSNIYSSKCLIKVYPYPLCLFD